MDYGHYNIEQTAKYLHKLISIVEFTIIKNTHLLYINTCILLEIH